MVYRNHHSVLLIALLLIVGARTVHAQNYSKLIAAAISGDTSDVLELLDRGEDPNVRMSIWRKHYQNFARYDWEKIDELSPLLGATLMGYPGVVRLLIDHDAEPYSELVDNLHFVPDPGPEELEAVAVLLDHLSRQDAERLYRNALDNHQLMLLPVIEPHLTEGMINAATFNHVNSALTRPGLLSFDRDVARTIVSMMSEKDRETSIHVARRISSDQSSPNRRHAALWLEVLEEGGKRIEQLFRPGPGRKGIPLPDIFEIAFSDYDPETPYAHWNVRFYHDIERLRNAARRKMGDDDPDLLSVYFHGGFTEDGSSRLIEPGTDEAPTWTYRFANDDRSTLLDVVLDYNDTTGAYTMRVDRVEGKDNSPAIPAWYIEPDAIARALRDTTGVPTTLPGSDSMMVTSVLLTSAEYRMIQEEEGGEYLPVWITRHRTRDGKVDFTRTHYLLDGRVVTEEE